MQAKKDPITSLRGGPYSYTLVAVTRGKETTYTISATDGKSERATLSDFTDSECLAEAYLTLLARNVIAPSHMKDVWEDILF